MRERKKLLEFFELKARYHHKLANSVFSRDVIINNQAKGEAFNQAHDALLPGSTKELQEAILEIREFLQGKQ